MCVCMCVCLYVCVCIFEVISLTCVCVCIYVCMYVCVCLNCIQQPVVRKTVDFNSSVLKLLQVQI